MSTFNADAIGAVAEIAARTGIDVCATSTGLTVAGVPVPLPAKSAAGAPELKGSYGELLGIQGLLPTVPQGDDRDRLLWWIVGDARDQEASPTDLLRDLHLATQLPNRVGFTDPDANIAIAAAMQDRFFSAKQTRNLKPMHSSLPMNYTYGTGTGKGTETDRPARWRMFSAELIVFLLQDPATGDTDHPLLERLLRFFEEDSDLTSIDRLFLDLARQDVPFPDARPSSQVLIDKYEPRTRADAAAAGGAFCPASLRLFRRDLETVLDTELPKPDKLQWLTLLISLHVAVRMYRLALIKGNELDLALAASTDTPSPPEARTCPCEPSDPDATHSAAVDCLRSCPLAGAIKFRTGSGRYRPVSKRDPSYASHTQLDQRKLLALPAVLVTTNLALRAWTALGGPPHQSASAADLAVEMRASPDLRSKINAVCASIAALHHSQRRVKAPTHVLLRAAGFDDSSQETPGLLALRDSVLQLRRSDLRHQSRDVVNQLLLDANAAGGGSLMARNGVSHTFFEADERMILMLVRLVCHDGPKSYEDFIAGISVYGLAPQDSNERAALADSLERLGLLVRYSDAGEASFVHYD